MNLIEQTMGIIDLLNEEARLPKSTPETFVRKMMQKHSRQPYFDKPLGSKVQFFTIERLCESHPANLGPPILGATLPRQGRI